MGWSLLIRRLSPILLLSLLATSALASDGVLEINQTCAAVDTEKGCFPGDDPGLLVEITQPGSDLLTSNLTVPDEDTDGIVVSTPSVGIDLGGFEIVRSGCEGVITNGTPVSGTGLGIKRSSSLNVGISVKNGSVTGMGSRGVSLGEQAEVKKLRVRWNRQDGILVDRGSTVLEDAVYQNG